MLVLLTLTAVLGATQDMGSDGVYVTTLPPKEQAKYLGFQSMCWNAGILLAQGPFVTVSGVLHEKSGSWVTAWMLIMLRGEARLRTRLFDVLPEEGRAWSR